MAEQLLMLSGGPASTWIDAEQNIGPRFRWALADEWPDTPPDALWLCRIEWPIGEWRVRLAPEGLRGRSALYWLERDRHDNPAQAGDGAFIYDYVPDAEVAEYAPEHAAAAHGVWPPATPAVSPTPGSST